jgi:hypothetical protein
MKMDCRSLRALMVFGVLCGCIIELSAQTGPKVAYHARRPARLSTGDAVAFLNAFRSTRIPGEYCLRFELKTRISDSGEEQVFLGSIQGGFNESGPVNRLNLTSESISDATERNLLLQNGVDPMCWERVGDHIETLTVSQLHAPLFPGMVFSVFELQMPFIYWDNFVYEGSDYLIGRPAQIFVLNPPQSESSPSMSSVRVWIDEKFKALLKAEILTSEQTVWKVFKIISLKKIEGEYRVKTIELLDTISGDKTRFTLLGGRFDQQLNPAVFTREGLMDSALDTYLSTPQTESALEPEVIED